MSEVNLKPHPTMLAWEKFEKANASSFELSTLGADPKYLRNRIMAAFLAGYEAAESRVPTTAPTGDDHG